MTSLALFMSGLDNLVVVTALPTIRTQFHASIQDLEWTVNAYTLTFAVLLLTGAALGDRFGRRRVLAIGLAVFTTGSTIAALAPSAHVLIVARAIQGCGAAAILPLTLTLLSTSVPETRRAVALGIWSGINGLAVALGPVVGGFIIEHGSWQWIFWVNVPVGVLLLPLVRFRLQESRGPNSKLDVIGTVLAAAGLLGIVYALVRGNTDGWTSTRILTPMIIGTGILVIFVVWELHNPHPMLPMRLFRSRGFAAINAVGLLTFLGLFGSIFLLTQYLQGVRGYSPLAAGTRTLPWTAMPILVAPLAGIVANRVGAKPVIAIGIMLMDVALSRFAAITDIGTPYSSMVIPMAACGIGMSMYFAPLAFLVMRSVPEADRGMASGVSNAVRELGGVLGVATLVSVFTTYGDLDSAPRFIEGLTPALRTGTYIMTAAVVTMLFVPNTIRRYSGRHTQRQIGRHNVRVKSTEQHRCIEEHAELVASQARTRTIERLTGRIEELEAEVAQLRGCAGVQPADQLGRRSH